MTNNRANDIQQAILDKCGWVEKLPNEWYLFSYGGMQYVYIYNCNNVDVLQMSIPCIKGMEIYSDDWIIKKANEVNREMKYVKIILFENGKVSLGYDHKIVGEENIREIISHMIDSLDFASKYFVEKLRALKI